MPTTRSRGGTKPRARRRYWSHKVKTVSTYPPKGLFSKDAKTIARSLASKRVSPKGIGSGMRMLSFYINRAGHNLSRSRREELQKAKRILRRMSEARGR